jgi:serralysin
MDILTSPLPSAIPGVIFDLSDNASTPDNVQLTPGLLANYPFGLRALSGDDTVVGSADGEIIFGNLGLDRLSGEGGNDSIASGRDNDLISGGDGDDLLAGNIGNDVIEGNAGNDSLFGGQNNDVLVGGAGNDTLSGDFGLDALVGREGQDTFILRADNTATLAQFAGQAGDADILIDFQKADDRIALTGGLTEASLTFTELKGQPVTITPQVQEVLNLGIITLADLDPNGDGLADATLIGVRGTSQFVGVALNVAIADLQGRFVSI